MELIISDSLLYRFNNPDHNYYSTLKYKLHFLNKYINIDSKSWRTTDYLNNLNITQDINNCIIFLGKVDTWIRCRPELSYHKTYNITLNNFNNNFCKKYNVTLKNLEHTYSTISNKEFIKLKKLYFNEQVNIFNDQTSMVSSTTFRNNIINFIQKNRNNIKNFIFIKIQTPHQWYSDNIYYNINMYIQKYNNLLYEIKSTFVDVNIDIIDLNLSNEHKCESNIENFINCDKYDDDGMHLTSFGLKYTIDKFINSINKFNSNNNLPTYSINSLFNKIYKTE